MFDKVAKYLEHSRTLSNILEHCRTFQNILEHSRTFSTFLEISTPKLTPKCLELCSTFQNILEHSRPLQNSYIQTNCQMSRTLSNILEHCRTSQNILEHSRTLSSLSRTPTSKLTAKCLEISRTFSNILEFAGQLDMTENFTEPLKRVDVGPILVKNVLVTNTQIQVNKQLIKKNPHVKWSNCFLIIGLASSKHYWSQCAILAN